MQVYTRFKPIRKKKGSPWLFLFILLAASALTIWWWWASHQNPERSVAAPGKLQRQDSKTRVTNPQPTPNNPAQTNYSRIAPTEPRPGLVTPPVEISGASPRVDVYPHPVRDLFEAQLALARLGLSPGSLDGAPGPRTRAVLLAFQRQEKLPATGALDSLTKSKLLLRAPVLTNYLVTANDLLRLRPLGKTWLEKSKQDRLDYESILELAAEMSQTHPGVIRQLNPGIDWTNIAAGVTIVLPSVARLQPAERAAFARIELEHRTLLAFDRNTNLIAHFPCSIAKFAEKQPVGELHVAILATNPNYTFDPANFPESAEARELDRKLILQPGPNNPVGTVWIGLDRPGYGIHGTPSPDRVGRAESHGCFRLANWNAEYFLQLAWVGMPVYVEP